MAQDIRKMFREDTTLPSRPPKGHQKRFEARLEEALPQERKNPDSGRMFYFLRIAAVLVVVLGISFFFLNREGEFAGEQFTTAPTETKVEAEDEIPVTKEYQLSDVSPEFKKVEDYYLASLNMELAKLDVNENNKELIDSFMSQLAGLDREYQKLNAEINESGLTEGTIEAMVSNLQLRLDLLYKLKNKINDINQSKIKQNENHRA